MACVDGRSTKLDWQLQSDLFKFERRRGQSLTSDIHFNTFRILSEQSSAAIKMARNIIKKSLTLNFGKAQTSPDEVDQQEQKDEKVDMSRSVFSSSTQQDTIDINDGIRFATLLIDLIPDVQIMVLCLMSLGELLDFRLVCRRFHSIINWHQRSLAVQFTKRGPLRNFATLYRPLSIPWPLNLDQLLGLTHRFYVVEHISIFLAKFHLIQVRRLNPPSLVDQPENAITAKNMAGKMKPYLLMLYHFIEMYRAGLAEAVRTHQYPSGPPSENISRQVEAEIIRKYNGNAIRRLCLMSKFLVKVIARRLRPASYAGKFERFLRGWSKDPASEAQCMELLVIGTLETINKTITLSGFPARIAAIERNLQGFYAMKTPDHRSSRSMSIISRRSSTASDIPGLSNTIMPRLDPETLNRISQILPERDDFLNVERLESLFKPGLVLANQVSTPWALAAAMMGSEDEDTFEFAAGTSGSNLDNDNQWGIVNTMPYIWPSFTLSTPTPGENSVHTTSSDDG